MKSKAAAESDLSHLSYRPCVGIMLLNQENNVFIGKRLGKKGQESIANAYIWQMPQGGIDADEDPYEAALRELYEETNIRTTEYLAEAPEWYSYDLPSEMIGKSWKGRYRGQIQKWFALRFTGHEKEIDTINPAGGKHMPEFDQWRWVGMNELPELIIPFKRNVYRKVVEAFSYLVHEKQDGLRNT